NCLSLFSLLSECHVAPRCTLFPYTTLFRSWLVTALWNCFRCRFVCNVACVDCESRDAGEPHVCLLYDWKEARTTIFLLVRAFFIDRKSTRLNSSHVSISYAVFGLKRKRI